MSQSVNAPEITRAAGADLSAKKYFIVKLDTNGNVVLAAAATDAILGVLQNKPQSGEAALVRFGGTTKVVAGGSISINAFVTTDNAGKAVATTTDGDIVIGVATEAADAGDIIEVRMGIEHLYIA